MVDGSVRKCMTKFEFATRGPNWVGQILGIFGIINDVDFFSTNFKI